MEVASSHDDIATVAYRRSRGSFWRCKCGHALYDHGRTKFSGNVDYTFVGCRMTDCPCERYKASDGSRWPDGPAGELAA